jgi:hypothetical protein
MDCRVKPGNDEIMMLMTAEREAMRIEDNTDDTKN